MHDKVLAISESISSEVSSSYDIIPTSTDTDMMPHLKKYTDGIREGELWSDNGI